MNGPVFPATGAARYVWVADERPHALIPGLKVPCWRLEKRTPKPAPSWRRFRDYGKLPVPSRRPQMGGRP